MPLRYGFPVSVRLCCALNWVYDSICETYCLWHPRNNIFFLKLHLQKLVLQKQESLTTLALQCHCLQEVDLTECESLTNSICDVFSSGGGCPLLRSLILDSCEVRVWFCSIISKFHWSDILEALESVMKSTFCWISICEAWLWSSGYSSIYFRGSRI